MTARHIEYMIQIVREFLSEEMLNLMKKQQKVHGVIEVKEKINNKQKDDTADTNIEKSPKIYKNPRHPIPRSPYSTKSGVNVQNPKCDEINAEFCITELEPTSLEQALNDFDSKKWLEAIHAEIDSLNKNKAWNLVPRTTDMHVLSNQ